MENFLKFLIKVLTALTTIGFVVLTFLSIITGQHPIFIISSAMLSCLVGFMTYVDIKQLITRK